MVPSASRGIIDPTTLQIARVFEPLVLASRCAAIVSAVSPDCEIRTVIVPGAMIGSRLPPFAEVRLQQECAPALDHELARLAGVPTGAAGREVDLPRGAEILRSDSHFIHEDLAAVLGDSAQRGVAHGSRLLADFLEHEVLEAALFRSSSGPKWHAALSG